MKLNKKGMSMMEILVSIVLISIVLVFLMNLFLNVRNNYNQSKVASQYEVLTTNITDAVGGDIINHRLDRISCKEGYSTDERDNNIIYCQRLEMTYKDVRTTILSEAIKKELRVYLRSGSDFQISYKYGQDVTYQTEEERMEGVTRSVPDADALNKDYKYIILKKKKFDNNQYGLEIKVPLIDPKGNDYTINVYAFLDKEPF